MKQRTKVNLRKMALAFVELVMVCVVLCVIAAVALMIRLQAGSLDLAFAQSFVRAELNAIDPDINVEMDHALLEWSKTDSRPRITLKNVRLVNRHTDRAILGMDSVGLSLARGRLLLGHIVPRAIFIDRPLLSVMRDDTGLFRLNLTVTETDAKDDAEKPHDPIEQSTLLFNILETLSRAPEEMPANWPMKSLRMVVVSDAAMMVEDHAVNESWLVPRLDMRFRKSNDGLTAAATLWMEDERGDANIMLDAAYDRESKMLLSRLNLHHISSSFLATKFPEFVWLQGQNISLNGNAELALDSALKMRAGNFSLHADPGQINIPSLYDAPLDFENMNMRMTYDRSENIIHIEDVSAIIGDISVSVQADIHRNDDGGLRVPVTLRIPSLAQSSVGPIWPKPLHEKSITPWLLDHLSGGRVHDAVVNLEAEFSPTTNPATGIAPDDDNVSAAPPAWSMNLKNLTADFGIADMNIDYRAPLMPVKSTNGSGRYDLSTDILSFDVASGTLGDLAVSDGTVVIDTITGDGVGTAKIDLRLMGPLKTVFEYIRAEPIEAGRDFPVALDKITGDVDLNVSVNLPTAEHVKTEDVKVGVDGVLNNVSLPGLVSGLDVSGTNLKMVLSGNDARVSGAGTIDGRAMNFEWHQFLATKDQPYDYKVVADAVIDQGLRDHFGVDLNDWVAGSAPAKITYVEKQDRTVTLDLNIDATPATLMVKPFQYVKKPGVAASASARVNLGPGGVLKNIRNLSITTPDADVKNALLNVRSTPGGPEISDGEFVNARLGNTKATLKFNLNSDDVLRLDVTGASFDARPFLDNDTDDKQGDAPDGPAIIASVKTDHMLTNEDQFVRDAQVYLEMDRRGEVTNLQTTARVGTGAGGVNFSYKPDDAGRMVLDINSDDAGATLKAFGYYKNMVGGDLLVRGVPPENVYRGKLNGLATISNFRVVDAPVLARLLNAMSLTGILQLLGNDGVDFTRLKANFIWEQRYGGAMLTILDGKTAGSAMGLTFQGTIDEAKDDVNIKGTVVPVSMVNDLVSSLPLIGDIITGGGGAVFAATYTITGPTEDPKTSVNPLAVLAPGFLRKLFFEGD